MRIAESISPVRVFAVVLAVVFAVEAIIMLGPIAARPFSREALLPALIDAVALVCVLCPVLWLLVVRPLRSLVAQRGRLLNEALRIQEEERARLARDLHDELGQVQTAILLGLRSVVNARTLEEAHERGQSVHAMAVAAVDASRRMARGLSPSVLTDFGLAPAVERVCEDLAEASGIEIDRHITPASFRLDPAVEIASYRVIQEALTNAVKHSGATLVRVALALENDRLLIEVVDNGRGTPPAEGGAAGLGLAGMRERIVLVGGRLEFVSAPSSGTTVRATIPVNAARP